MCVCVCVCVCVCECDKSSRVRMLNYMYLIMNHKVLILGSTEMAKGQEKYILYLVHCISVYQHIQYNTCATVHPSYMYCIQ